MRGILEIPSVAFKLCSRHTAAHTTHSLCCFYISKHDMLTMFKAILPVKPCFLQHWCRLTTEEEMLKLPDPAAEAAAVWFSGRDFRRADGQKVSRWNAGKLCVDVGAGVILPPRAQISRAPLAHHSIGCCVKLSANGFDRAACCKKE